ILTESVRAHPFNYDGFRMNISLSVGIAQYTEAMKTPQELYYAADKALYQAKNAGRNCYRVYADAIPQLQERITS
ncbi:MAG: diguanylate cyclase, partial [Thiobacillus sp.]|nr:diguanylate cyclase [Thiobacillus sp.]